MALFSLKKIAALARNRQAYLRGISLYNAGRVQNMRREQNRYYAEFITADVQGEQDAPLITEIGFDTAGEPEYLYCSCGQFEDGACRHIVATLADKYYKDMIGGLTPASCLYDADTPTVEAARQLMNRYFAGEAIAARPVKEPITLTPTLLLSGGQASLQLAVGCGKRSYIVKSISRFFDAVENGEDFAYSDQFSFYHTKAAFTPDGQTLLSLLFAQKRALRALGRCAPTGRELPLSPAACDRLFELYEGQTLSVRMERQTYALPLVAGDPPLAITAQKRKGGFAFLTPFAMPFFGAAHFFVATDTALFRTTSAFENAGDWLIAAHAAGGELTVSDDDLPAFCAKVLTVVEPLLPVTGDGEWRDFLPQPLLTRLYLDCREGDTVTAAVQFCYGEVQLPLFTPAKPRECRDLRGERAVQTVIEQYFTGFLPATGEATLHDDDERLFDFLTEGLPRLEALCEVFATDAFRRLRPAPPPKVAVGVNIAGDLLELSVDLSQWDRNELAALLAAFRENRRFSRLKSGAFVSLSDENVQALLHLTDELSLTPAELKSGRVTLPRYRALQLQSLMNSRPQLHFRQAAVFKALAQEIENATAAPYPVPNTLENVLRPYQKEGYRWLRALDAAGFGGILADDMGLGKTLQIISLLTEDAARSPLPSLVVCPTSLVLNWVSELHRFAPHLTVLAVTGDAPLRAALLSDIGDYRVLVTSYDLLKRDILLYKDLHFHYHILDEAQYIKNQQTQNARAVKAIASERRFALTGTPMEDRLSELWSIFDFLMPGFLYSYSYFKKHFELPIVRDGEKAPLSRLAVIIAPFLLRRLKKDVLKELPPKTEQVLTATMDEAQEKLYAACAAQVEEKIHAELAAGTFEKSRLSVLTLLMRLRQICCDPSLCTDGYKAVSCKRQACLEVVRQACDNGHRVLLFSQFTSMLSILERDLDRTGISHMTLVGSTPAAERAQLVQRFNTGDTQVFLISLKAGGTGLNLTGADVVIHYDPWWNLAAQQQATDRAHRIGQENPVQVVRLVVQNTVEEKILRLQEQKQEIADAVLSGGITSLSALSAQELLQLL